MTAPATRQTFAGLAHWEIVFWYGLIVVSTAVFFWGVARLARRYRRGRPTVELHGIGLRALRAAGGRVAAAAAVTVLRRSKTCAPSTYRARPGP